VEQTDRQAVGSVDDRSLRKLITTLDAVRAAHASAASGKQARPTESTSRMGGY
jgi:hypothetical protein